MALLLLPSHPADAGSLPSPDQDGIIVALRSAAVLHPTIRSRVEEFRALGFDLSSEEARRYPSLSLQAQSMTDDQTQVFARLQQPIWVGGRIDGAIDQAGAKLQVGKTSLLAVQRQVMEDTAATYAALQGIRQRLKAADLNVQEHEKLLTLISRRQVGSIASEADVRLARSRLTLAVSQREQLRGQLTRTITDLQALTQMPLDAAEPVPEALMALPERSSIVPGVTDASAAVRQRQLEVDVARTEAELRKADMMPSLYARFDQDIYSSNKVGTLPVETRAGIVLEGSLEGVGFSGWNRVRSADSRVDAARRDVESARNEARRRAQALLAEVESLQVIMQSNEDLVSATEGTLASFMRQYDAGRKSWVDVLNAQREFSDARLSLEQTRSSLQENRLRLAVELGMLDSAAEIKP
ncbi:MAG TPA: TolC family protein [Geobacteraceae bacterium]|nr:TolC family protein [Geobacteraceae bacterium]